MVRKLLLGLGLIAVLSAATWAWGQEAAPTAPEAEAPVQKIEDHPAAQSLILFNLIYQAEYDAKELAAFEKEATGLEVIWLGKITNVPASGEHLVVAPLVTQKDSNFDVFVVAKLVDEKQKLADVAAAGDLIILKGKITSFGTNGPIVTAEKFMIGKPKNDK